MPIFNIIIACILVALVIASFIYVRKLSFIKLAFDDILIKEMKDHELFIKSHKNIIKEYQVKFNDVMKIEKDINTIKTGLKLVLEDLKNKIKNLDDINNKK